MAKGTFIRSDHWQTQASFVVVEDAAATIVQYRKLTNALCTIFLTHWPQVRGQSVQDLERLFHATATNPETIYGAWMIRNFPRFPAYLRRAATMAAMGAVSSYQTRYRTWQAGIRAKRDARPPTWGGFQGYPVLYAAKEGAGAMIKRAGDGVELKLYCAKTQAWSWHLVPIVKRGGRHAQGHELLSPTLMLKGRKLSLVQPLEIPTTWANQQSIKLKAGSQELVCSIDLGMNTQATCSIIASDGTVIDRLFLHPSAHMARLTQCLTKIQQCARKTMGGVVLTSPGESENSEHPRANTGGRSIAKATRAREEVTRLQNQTELEALNQAVLAGAGAPAEHAFGLQPLLLPALKTTAGKLNKGFCSTLYRRAAGLNTHMSRDTARKIIAFARLHGANTMVFEDLKGFRPKGGAKRSNLRARFHSWLHRKLVRQVQASAQEKGMQVVLVNPRGTSAWAYDGSGRVSRDEANYSLCTFTTGKRYNSDLNAAYNIAARYFWRKLEESVRVQVQDQLKVSSCPSRNGRAGAKGKSSLASQRTPVTLSHLWVAAKLKPLLQP